MEGVSCKINTSVLAKAGWRGFYECFDKLCAFASTITVSEDGLSEPIVVLKKEHTCLPKVGVSALIEVKQEMVDMVKTLALDQQATKAPVICILYYCTTVQL
jgi:hypothetical protein